LHSPRLEDLSKNESTITMLVESKKKGMIRAFGVSVRSPQDGLEVLERYPVDTIQVNYNMIDQRAIESGLFQSARAKGIGIICRTPLVFGYLTGTLTGEEKLSGIDHRANWPAEQLKKWAEAPRLFEKLNRDKGRTAVQTALLFCLARDEVSTVIPGMLTPEHVRENVSSSDLLLLTAEELSRINAIYRNHDFYDKEAKVRGKQ
jgi:aryl-alcohol dehydrogenase-like predicted oxidoreductase